MPTKNLPLRSLRVNRSNDRHGELENETAAIAWLFRTREQHMRNLARDIVGKAQIYEPPLVSPEGKYFTVFDGNRRITCLKLLEDPRRAPTADLQDFFRKLRTNWKGRFPRKLECRLETDRDHVDEILYRRHTGTQSGVGQSTWDDRMKGNFVARTGKGSGLSVADEIEDRLTKAHLLPTRKIPRSTMNRLLSAELFRNRVGFSINRKRFEFTHQEQIVLAAMARIAHDLSIREIVLGDIWDIAGKTKYLNRLEREGVLPTAAHALPKAGTKAASTRTRTGLTKRQTTRMTLIPQKDFGIAWPGRLQRHHEIWEELQFRLELSRHVNAISVLFRVLLELSVEDYIRQQNVNVYDGDKLAARMLKAAKHLQSVNKIDSKQLGIISKFQHLDQLVSADTLNRYVHSPNFAPSPDHLRAMWDTLADFVVLCLSS